MDSANDDGLGTATMDSVKMATDHDLAPATTDSTMTTDSAKTN